MLAWLRSGQGAPESAASRGEEAVAPPVRGQGRRRDAGVQPGSLTCGSLCSAFSSPCAAKGWMRQEARASSEAGPRVFSGFCSFTMTPVAHRYKSNEEYVYVRGRGRGKYVCEECGIRCKKPSMLKKHIRTHTDVRPYVCKHCHFAFKTKGKRRSAGHWPCPLQGAPLWEPQHRARGPDLSAWGLGTPNSWAPQWQSSPAPDGAAAPGGCPAHPPPTRPRHPPPVRFPPPPGGGTLAHRAWFCI